MKRFFLSIIMMAAAVVGVKAQYDGQCVNFKLSTGDSIPVELSFCQSLNPQVKDGNIVWNLNFDTPRGSVWNKAELRDCDVLCSEDDMQIPLFTGINQGTPAIREVIDS